MVSTIEETRQLDESTIDEFAGKVRGDVIRPAGPSYNEARSVQNGLIDRRPALIVRVSGVADVVEAVNFARELGLLLSIRGGGHNVAGNAVNDGGMVIDLLNMRAVHVDPVARTARVQGGATWADVDRETQLFGLATPGGIISSTGVAGLTLHGGWGVLRRKYGYSLDNLISVDIVTADGQIRTANETENSDLFWAIRGAGSNFGVVTSFEFRLHPVGPLVAMAAPAYPLEDANSVIRNWSNFADSASEDISFNGLFWSVPSAPMFPEELHGKAVFVALSVYAGSPEIGESAVQPVRELGTPILDLSGVLPYVSLQSAFDWAFPKGNLYYWKSLYLNGLDDEVVEAVLRLAADRPTPETAVELWHLGGAPSRVAPDATAFGSRDAPYLLTLSTTWTQPSDSDRCIAWTRAAWADMQRFSDGGLYLNFAGFGEEKEALVRAGYGANFSRLAELKAKYDPGNLFRMNQNIPPAI